MAGGVTWTLSFLGHFQEVPVCIPVFLPLPSCAVSVIACRSEDLGGASKLFCYANAGGIIFKLRSLLNHTFFSGKVLSGAAKQSKVVCAKCNGIDAKSLFYPFSYKLPF